MGIKPSNFVNENLKKKKKSPLEKYIFSEDLFSNKKNTPKFSFFFFENILNFVIET